MSALNTDIYALADRDARVILGMTKHGHGRGSHTVNVANEDPLAWWCLVELLVSYSQPALRNKRIETMYRPKAKPKE